MLNDDRYRVQCPDPPYSPQVPVTDVMHGHRIVDPYRWLEDCNDPRTVAWTKKHNERTDRIMAQLPHREAIQRGLTTVLSQDIVGGPRMCGGVLFYTHRRAGEEQPRLCALKGGKEQVLFDPNRESTPMSLDWWYPSPDASMVAFGLSERGDEWSTLQILDVTRGDLLPEKIERARWANVAWQPDSSGFHYTRCMHHTEVTEEDVIDHRRVFHHRIGQDVGDDPMVYGLGRPNEEMYEIKSCQQEGYVMLLVNHGWKRHDVYLHREQADGNTHFRPLLVGEDALFAGDIAGDTAYLVTDLDAPRFRIITVDLAARGEQPYTEIVPEQADLTLGEVALVGDKLLVSALKDAVSHLYTCDLDGSNWTEVPLPFAGTVSELASGSNEACFLLQSFARSPAIYHLDMQCLETREIKSSPQVIDPEDFVVTQIFYSSRDGTRVPMTVIHGRDHDGSSPSPTVLTGYGGFNISLTPTYSPVPMLWVQAGGVYAVANIRGGGEYGGTWHRAATLGNRQKAYDDFIGAAECLIETGYTDSERLGVLGGSNGGLLVGAFMTQRPELARAVVCGVPVLDMLRYHMFLIGPTGIYEYGSAENPEQFEWLYRYSPYHRVQEGTNYPAVYIFTALADSRVPPLHARKMTAKLIEASCSDHPIILHVESDAGHGAGKTMSQQIDGHLRSWAFMSWQCGLDWEAMR